MTAQPTGDLEVAGGGSVAVDTAAMLAASRVLAAAGDDLRAARRRIDAVMSSPDWGLVDPGSRAAALAAVTEAALAVDRSIRTADSAEQALVVAATRYGLVESAVTRAATFAEAGLGVLAGVSLRMAAMLGPGAVAALVVTGVAALAVVDGPIVIGRLIRRTDPFSDPILVAEIRAATGSLDDATRGFLGTERASDLFVDQPTAPFGSAVIAASLANAAQLLSPADPRLVVEPVESTPRAVTGPRSLEELADRMTPSSPGQPQVRIERYEGTDGVVRWIVSISGTVTFAPDSGSEPFDMRSNLAGVGEIDSASVDAVLQAMAASGIRPDDPVLLIGHSQGALDAVRVAQRGDYDVAGVVALGGPTGQMTLPASVPEVSVEHTNDLVPVLGGVAATGAAGLRRVVVRRAVPDSELADEPVAAHDGRAYAVTVGMAERSGAPQVQDFERSVAPFLTGGEGTAVRWRADRASGRR